MQQMVLSVAGNMTQALCKYQTQETNLPNHTFLAAASFNAPETISTTRYGSFSCINKTIEWIIIIIQLANLKRRKQKHCDMLLTFFKKIRNNYRLVKLFRVVHHLLEHFPRFIPVRTGDAKLFDFLKLMNTENAKLVSSMGTSFCSKAGRVTSISGPT